MKGTGAWLALFAALAVTGQQAGARRLTGTNHLVILLV